MSKYDDLIKEAEHELYQALEALEERDLSYVRSCTARAQAHVIDAFQEGRRAEGDRDPMAA